MIWLLWEKRTGDLAQMKALADALDRPYQIRMLNRDPLEAPWPSAVICAEARASRAALALKRKVKIRIIALARPAGHLNDFDLIITTPQFGLPKLQNILEVTLPLGANSFSLAPPSNIIAVLVGASAAPDVLDAVTAAKMGGELLAYGQRSAKTLHVITSPRTSSDVADVFRQKISAPHQLWVWQKHQPNPYRDILCTASEFIVTSDSVSMVADALATGRPVKVYRLPQKLNVIQTWIKSLWRRNPLHWMFDNGWVEATPDRVALIEKLRAQKYLTWFGENAAATATFDPTYDLEKSVSAVQKLLGS